MHNNIHLCLSACCCRGGSLFFFLAGLARGKRERRGRGKTGLDPPMSVASADAQVAGGQWRGTKSTKSISSSPTNCYPSTFPSPSPFFHLFLSLTAGFASHRLCFLNLFVFLLAVGLGLIADPLKQDYGTLVSRLSGLLDQL